MDSQSVKVLEAQCIQEQPPFCTAACPIHVDARGVVERVRKGDFKGAFTLYARFVPIPEILSRVCDHPCEGACKRGEAGEALRIGTLERACAVYGSPVAVPHRSAAKDLRIAVVGGGLSGLTAAAELSAKGYEVTIFESASQLLPRIRTLGDSILPPSAIEADLRFLSKFEVEVRLNSHVDDVSALAREFDAVYAGLGEAPGAPLGAIEPLSLSTGEVRIFAGGSCRFRGEPYSPIRSVQDGKCAAVSIDRFLQGASLSASREMPGPSATRLFTSTRGVSPEFAVPPDLACESYSKEAAVREANRCLPCGCLECVKVCEYLAHYKSYPKRYVREIFNNETIVLGARPANRMINSCTLCGLCAEVCPEKLSMGAVCLDAREGMVTSGRMPASAHEFALRDMEFSISDAFSLARNEPGFDTSAALFFPGCQLSGSSPNHVLNTYQLLRKHIPGGVGLVLGCCGAPAQWAGQRHRSGEVLGSFLKTWTSLGQPRVITACSSCYRALNDQLPQIPVDPLWSVLEDLELASLPGAMAGRGDRPRRMAIHDPCGTRGVDRVEGGARRLLAKVGVEIEELNAPNQTTCCGYGGLARFANPEVADKIVARRVSQSPADYVTYCAMCRDSFARQGKRALHLLDLLFDDGAPDAAGRPDPGFSQRQENRAHLKTRLLREIWNEPMADLQPEFRLLIAPEVSARLDRRMILLDDLRAVIAHAESTGEKLENLDTGRIVASHRPACVTYWVEYSPTADGFVVHNAYSHRMKVD